MIRELITILIAALVLGGCSGVKINEYSENTPRLDLFEYFTGETKGWGIVQSRSGELKRQFVVDIKGTINSDMNLELDENFLWSDGEKTRRIWTISKTGKHDFTGTADDVAGNAQGSSYGNTLNWNYKINLSVDGTNWLISFDDWMFLQPDGVLLNRAVMSKFGFRVGEVIISFQKRPVTLKD